MKRKIIRWFCGNWCRISQCRSLLLTNVLFSKCWVTYSNYEFRNWVSNSRIIDLGVHFNRNLSQNSVYLLASTVPAFTDGARRNFRYSRFMSVQGQGSVIFEIPWHFSFCKAQSHLSVTIMFPVKTRKKCAFATCWKLLPQVDLAF